MSDPRDLVVSATVVTQNHEHAARVAEVLARAAAGLMLEGIGVSVRFDVLDEEDAEVP